MELKIPTTEQAYWGLRAKFREVGLVKRNLRQKVLLANGVFLILAGLVLGSLSLLGHFLSAGPFQEPLHQAMPLAALFFIEDFGLALVTEIIFLKVSQTDYPRFWNILASCLHLFMGTANIAFWAFFTTFQSFTIPGIAATIAHGVFFVLEGYCATLR